MENNIYSYQQYNIIADFLNKFHTSTEWIQFIWIIATAIVCASFILLLKEAIKSFSKQPVLPEGKLVYSVYKKEHNNKIFVFKHDSVPELVVGETILLLPAEKAYNVETSDIGQNKDLEELEKRYSRIKPEK